mmetsp:Transcript_45890/g.73821  ORF Transcript_45890/g.73821 Transcript_45890/m.73821 type:complete len:316 (-) Transcript_45890:34-981(-)
MKKGIKEAWDIFEEVYASTGSLEGKALGPSDRYRLMDRLMEIISSRVRRGRKAFQEGLEAKKLVTVMTFDNLNDVHPLHKALGRIFDLYDSQQQGRLPESKIREIAQICTKIGYDSLCKINSIGADFFASTQWFPRMLSEIGKDLVRERAFHKITHKLLDAEQKDKYIQILNMHLSDEDGDYVSEHELTMHSLQLSSQISFATKKIVKKNKIRRFFLASFTGGEDLCSKEDFVENFSRAWSQSLDAHAKELEIVEEFLINDNVEFYTRGILKLEEKVFLAGHSAFIGNSRRSRHARKSSTSYSSSKVSDENCSIS